MGIKGEEGGSGRLGSGRLSKKSSIDAAIASNVQESKLRKTETYTEEDSSELIMVRLSPRAKAHWKKYCSMIGSNISVETRKLIIQKLENVDKE